MRIGVVLYWCVLAFHLCKAEDVERTESREGGRRQQWGPVVRSSSYSGDTVNNEHSKFDDHEIQTNIMTPVDVLHVFALMMEFVCFFYE